MIPIYMINGFLDSGKTEFIQYTLSQPYFQSKAKTLLLVCEEGEIEYDEDILKKSNTVMEIVEEEEDFHHRNIMLEKKHRPSVYVEYNGMWNVEYEDVALESGAADYLYRRSDFSTYFTNMKSLLAEMLRKSELIMNRCTVCLISFIL